jgi:hypothetical protein
MLDAVLSKPNCSTSHEKGMSCARSMSPYPILSHIIIIIDAAPLLSASEGSSNSKLDVLYLSPCVRTHYLSSTQGCSMSMSGVQERRLPDKSLNMPINIHDKHITTRDRRDKVNTDSSLRSVESDHTQCPFRASLFLGSNTHVVFHDNLSLYCAPKDDQLGI